MPVAISEPLPGCSIDKKAGGGRINRDGSKQGGVREVLTVTNGDAPKLFCDGASPSVHSSPLFGPMQGDMFCQRIQAGKYALVVLIIRTQLETVAF